MRLRIGQLGIPFVLGIGLLSGVLILLPLTSRLARAAPGDTYCVLQPSGPIITSVCDELFTSVQAAVDMAGGGETILVAAGHYTQVHRRGGLTQSVYLSQTVTIHGGYTVPFDLPPDPVANPTILDAQGQGRVLYISGDISPTIVGLHLTGGNASHLGGRPDGDAGGGIYVVDATVTLSNNVIYENTASESRVGFGGGVYLTAAQAILAGNTIRHNLGSRVDNGAGGGLAAEQSNIIVNDNAVFSNTASLLATTFGFGGGIHIDDSFTSLNRNTIMSNTALNSGAASGSFIPFGYGGGLSLFGERPMTVSHNLIQDNVAKRFGHADGIGGGVVAIASAPITLQDNIILGNVAAITGIISIGGGLYISEPEPQGELVLNLVHNTIQENTAAVSARIGAGGGLFLCCQARLWDNTIISNTALISETGPPLVNATLHGGIGGGLYIRDGRISLDGDFIQANFASHSDNGTGGGLYLETSEAIFTNTVLSDNRAATFGPGIAVGGGSEVDLIHVTIARNQGGDGSGVYLSDLINETLPADIVRSRVALTNAIVANQAIGIRVTSNNTATLNSILWHATPITISASPTAVVSISNQFSGNPVFASDGYHILPGSMAIDRGILAGVLVDIDTQPRSGVPDLGADEYAGPIHESYLPLIVRNE